MPGLLPATSWRAGGEPVSGGLTTVLLAVVVVAALYFGREVLVPVALAVLLSFVLAPLVRLLQRWYVPRTPRGHCRRSDRLCRHSRRGRPPGRAGQPVGQRPSAVPIDAARKDSSLARCGVRHRHAGARVRGAAGASQGARQARKAAPSSAPFPGERRVPERPIPVEVRQPDPGALQTLAALITPLVRPLTTTGIVVIFVIFILLQQQDLRNRLIRLAGAHDLQRTTAALDDAGQRLSRLFLMQLALNAGFGLVIGIGLWVIGVPNAPLWGMLAMILRFVPYIGAVIAAILPLVIAAAVGPGWTMVLWTALLFVIVEPLAGHVVEPLLFGHSTGLSPVAVIAAATFWTWLWGPIGLILATPLTVCLVVLGRHVDRLKFLDVMLGDQPALTPANCLSAHAGARPGRGRRTGGGHPQGKTTCRLLRRSARRRSQTRPGGCGPGIDRRRTHAAHPRCDHGNRRRSRHA